MYYFKVVRSICFTFMENHFSCGGADSNIGNVESLLNVQ